MKNYDVKEVLKEFDENLNKKASEIMPERVNLSFTLTGHDAAAFRFLMTVSNDGSEGEFAKEMLIYGMKATVRGVMEKSMEMIKEEIKKKL